MIEASPKEAEEHVKIAGMKLMRQRSQDLEVMHQEDQSLTEENLAHKLR